MKSHVFHLSARFLFLSVLVGWAAGQAQTITHQISLPAGDSWCDDSMINGLATQINLFRSQQGHPSLQISTLGMEDAEMRAVQFAAYMQDHTPGSAGFNPHTGYDTTAANLGYNLVSEALAYIETDPGIIVFSVWQDPLHLGALLTTEGNVMGVSCVFEGGIPYWSFDPGQGSATGITPPPPTPSPTPTPTPTPTQPSSPSAPSGTPALDSEDLNFLTAINNFRAQNGAGPLQVSIALENSSTWMSNDMATKNYFSHTDSLGRDPFTRMAAFGYNFSTAEGENLAAGNSGGQNTFTQFQTACDPDSSGACTFAHRQNMLNPSYVVIGIARAFNANSTFGWYWTTDFGGFLDATLNTGSGSNPPPTPAPVINSFTANPSSITAGQRTTLTWNVSGSGVSISINNGIGNVSNSTSDAVAPTQTTTYTLTATNGGGTVSSSVVVNVTPAQSPAPQPPAPQPPTTPSIASIQAKSQTEVDLSWTASSDSLGVSGYQVIRNGSVVAMVSASSLTFADTSVHAGTTYSYNIRAFDAAGNFSGLSNTAQATTPGAPVSSGPGPVISSFTASPSTISLRGVSILTWNVSGSGVTLSVDNGIGSVPPSAELFVRPTQTTTYTLTATNGAGSTTASATVTVISSGGSQPQPPTAPSGLSATAKSATLVDLTWGASSDSSGVAGYQIFRNGSLVTSVSGATLSYADSSVNGGTSYSYTVKAFDASNNLSGASNTAQVTTPTSSSGGSPAPAPSSSTTCQPPATRAFAACYYGNTSLSGNAELVRTDSQINFNWGSGSPGAPLSPNNFSVRWQGMFNFMSGTHMFTALTSDGMRVYIDGNLVLNQWKSQPPTTYTFQQTLSQGSHLITVEYYEQSGKAEASLSWQ